MLIDHLGCVLYAKGLVDYGIYSWMRFIGRIAFPIFGFLIVEGYKHTKDIRKYQLRLFIFALISQIPYTYFDLVIFRKWGLNVIWLFLFATILFRILDKIDKENKMQILFGIVIVGIFIALMEKFDISYGAFGMLYLILLYFGKYRIVGSIIITILYSMLMLEEPLKLFQLPCLLAIAPICLYNGKLGKRSKILQYGFYIFYPLHIFILCLFL